MDWIRFAKSIDTFLVIALRGESFKDEKSINSYLVEKFKDAV
jgi:hypothetical protein